MIILVYCLYKRLFVVYIAFLRRREEEKTKRLAEAQEKKELLECGCCFDDEVLPEDSLTCPEGHLFCRECIRRSSEEVVGKRNLLCF